MHLGTDFWEDLGRFWEPKWSHGGTRRGRKMHLILKAPKIQKTLKNQWNFNDFGGSGGPSWEPKSIKNRSKKEVNMGRHLGIDFSSILVDFGTQLGRQNPSKFDVKMHEKNE